MPQSHYQLRDIALDHAGFGRNHWAYRSQSASAMFDPARFAPHYPPDLELEPVHLEIDLALDLAEGRAAGSVTTHVRAQCAGAQALTLDAVDLAIADAADPDGRPLTWRYDGRKLYLRWQDAFAKGEQRRVRVDYAVTIPSAGLYFSRPTAAAPDAPWYAVTDHETERARHWLPCIDLPNVRTTLDIRLRANQRFTALANGFLVAETDHGDGSRTTHWRLEQRCPSYLVCFAVGDFVRCDDGEFVDGEHTIPVAYFCSPQHMAADLQRTFGRTKPMLAWMTRKFAAPFPFPKYYQWAAPGVSGAMENISLVSWDERFVLDEVAHGERGYVVDSVNVHEMAHSYFGDAVVCRDFAHAWLKESWATYVEVLWREDNTSAQAAQYEYYDQARTYFAEADNRYKRPIVNRHFRSSWDMYDAHTYPGGACRLHTLRNELGDDVFFAAVQDYLRRYNGQVVETDDFRHVLEEHSGRSLGAFFDQWFYKPGYPDLSVSFRYEADSSQGIFEIEQKQVDPAQDIPAFVLNTEVGWSIDGVDYTQPVRIERPREVVTVAMPKPPAMVRFDPHQQALHKLSFNPGDDLLKHQLLLAPDVMGRILAGQELVKTGRRPNIQAVVDAYRAEPFWGVRYELATALGAANTEAALEGIAGLLAEENDPLVLPELLAAAANYRDDRIRDAVLAKLDTPIGYAAQAAAYVALGAQRERAPYDLLAAAAQTPGFNGFAQAGAIRGLAATRRPQALDLLLSLVRPDAASVYVRPTAVAALADYGQGLERRERERVSETLTDLLRDPAYQVALAAARGLGALDATEAIPTLEAFARSRAAQEAAMVERVVDGLRKADKHDGSALQKQVESLTDRLRKLEDQVQRARA